MKQLKSFATFLMVVLCVLLVTSCNKEDNGDSQNDKEGNGDSQNVKRLVKILNTNYSVGEYEKIANFYYNDGKLSEIENYAYYNDNNGTYTYNDVITYTYIGKIVLIEGRGKYVLQLNSDGFVESGTYNTAKLDFEYSNGYLTKHTYSSQDGSTTDIIDIKYDNKGNILNISYDIPKWLKREYAFTSSNYPSKGKSICLFSIEVDEGVLSILNPIYYAGLLGKDPTNLVSKVEGWGEDYNYFQTYDYLLYDDGYINKMTRTQNSNPLSNLFFLYE